jgi:hypothetical protein
MTHRPENAWQQKKQVCTHRSGAVELSLPHSLALSVCDPARAAAKKRGLRMTALCNPSVAAAESDYGRLPALMRLDRAAAQ